MTLPKKQKTELIQTLLEEEITEPLGRSSTGRRKALDSLQAYRNGYGRALTSVSDPYLPRLAFLPLPQPHVVLLRRRLSRRPL
jgi:hypothetical protein